MTPNTAVATATGSGGSSGTNGGRSEHSGLKKGPWTASEDVILMEYVRKHGEGNWNTVQRNSGLNRCGKSCRLRWANHLRPNLKKGAFAPEEERLILELHAKYGNKWARMAAQLPGRTDNEIKNYWNTRVKRRQRQGLPLYPHDIRPQSQPTTPTSSLPPTSLTTPPSSTPTTPTSGPIFHFHSPMHSHPSTPPPPHSPLTSPHQPDHTFSSFPLMGSNTFTFHRPPPILATPVRFKHFRNNNGGFSHPISVAPPRSTTVLVHSPTPQLCPVDSFQFPMTLATSSPQTQILQAQFKTDGMMMSNCMSSVQQAELPSSQYHQNTHNGIAFDDAKINSAMTYTSSGLLEDLLEEAQTLACDGNSSNKAAASCFFTQEDYRLFDGFNKLENSNAACLFLSTKPNENIADRHGSSSANEDLSKLLNAAMPSHMQVPQWYSNKEDEVPYGQTSGLAAADDNLSLDVQHIAALFPVATEPDQPGRTNTSCPWDNLPGIC